MTKHRSSQPDPRAFTSDGRRICAGVLLRCTDSDGTTWYLLAQRSPMVNQPGTWANLGGGLDRGESPLAGALREFTEETGLPGSALVGSTIAKVIHTDNQYVDYTLFVVDVLEFFDNLTLGWENDDAYWYPTETVSTLPLHPGLAAAWPQIA